MLNLVLKQERIDKFGTQAALGAAARVDPAMISRAERSGYCYPGHLRRLADALGWSGEPEELLKEVE